jgi:hypothetical protein
MRAATDRDECIVPIRKPAVARNRRAAIEVGIGAMDNVRLECCARSVGAEGIAKAKSAGLYKGRPPSIEASRAREMKAQGVRPTDIAKALKIGRAPVHRGLGAPAG